MRKIILKEFRLSASCLSFFFIAFSLMFLIPGYPILCGVFFVTLGIFQSFQNARETNDILFSALLPVAKKDVVKGKFIFVCMIELLSLMIMAVITVIRMIALSRTPVYLNNALMNANGFALGLASLMFGLFNFLFVGGFFKTAYRFSGPFISYIIAGFITIGIGESLHYFPGLSFLNSTGTDFLTIHLMTLAVGALLYVLLTYTSYVLSCRRFEMIDL